MVGGEQMQSNSVGAGAPSNSLPQNQVFLEYYHSQNTTSTYHAEIEEMGVEKQRSSLPFLVWFVT